MYKIKLLTADHLDTAITQKTEDYTIIRQEGDILVASAGSQQNSNCICSLRDTSNVLLPNFGIFFVDQRVWTALFQTQK